LLYVSSVIAKEQKLEEGFRIVINDGENGGFLKIIVNKRKKWVVRANC